MLNQCIMVIPNHNKRMSVGINRKAITRFCSHSHSPKSYRTNKDGKHNSD